MRYSLVLLLMLLLPLQAQAQKVYRVGVAQMDYYPYSEIRNGEYRGLHRDLLDAFAEQAGVQFEYVPLPYIRSVKEFLAGRLDFQYPDAPGWLPEELQPPHVYYSDPAIPYVDGVSVLAERRDLDLERLQTLGTIIGFTLRDYAQRIKLEQLRLSEQAQVRGLIAQVLRQRLDGIYLNVLVVAHQAREMGVTDQIRFNPRLPFQVGYYRMSSLIHPELVEEFNLFLRQQDPLISELKARYGVDDLLFPLLGSDEELPLYDDQG